MLTKLREGVWWLDFRGVNAYLVDDDGVVTLVDAGPPWQAGAVLDGLVQAGFTLTDLERVLVTHFDVDHVAGLSRLGGLDVSVYASRNDAPLVAGERSPDTRTLKGKTQAVMSLAVGDSPAPVQVVEDGDTVGSFTVYETPGHTPGHVAYVSESLEAGFLGDLVVESDGRFELSPWYLSADTEAVRASIRSLSERSPAFEVAGPGHGIPFERGGKARLDELAGRI